MAEKYNPPIINFLQVPVEDRKASMEAGYMVMVDEDWIEVTPFGTGGKSKVVTRYKDWLERIQPVVSRHYDADNPPIFPQEWIDKVKLAYKAWKDGMEIPVDGTPLRNWPVLSPGQLRTAIAAGFMTVEQLAAGTEESVHHLGMGGRALIERAKEWVVAQQAPEAVISARLAAQDADLKEEKEKNKILAERLAGLEAALAAQAKKDLAVA